MKNKKNILILFCLLTLTVLFTGAISADVGNSFSGGGSFGGGGGGYGGGGFGSFIFLGGGSSPIGLIIMILFLVFMFYAKTRSGNNANQNTPYRGSGNHHVDNEPEAISKINEVDSDFSAEKFKAYASEVYITLQEAWESRDWKGVRLLESNALFNVHNRQIQEYINMKKTPHLDMQNVRSVSIAEFKVEGNQEIITVKLVSSLLDYTTDDESGKVLEGSKTQHQTRTYCLEFIRSAGVKTKTEKDISTTNCPNCGAPTKVTSSGECEYCGSIITTGEYGWVLNKYAAW